MFSFALYFNFVFFCLETVLSIFQLVTDEKLKTHTGFELYDIKELEDNCRKLRVEKTMSVHDLYKFVANNLVGKRTIFCFIVIPWF